MWAASDFVPRSERWGPPRRQGLCSQSAHLWAASDFVPRSERWGPPRRQGLCSQSAHLWAASDFVPRSERWGPPRRQGLYSQSAHLWATSDFVPLWVTSLAALVPFDLISQDKWPSLVVCAPLLLCGWIFCAYWQVNWMNRGLKRGHALLVVPTFHGISMPMQILAGSLFFKELPSDVFWFVFGTIIVLIGLVPPSLCSLKRHPCSWRYEATQDGS